MPERGRKTKYRQEVHLIWLRSLAKKGLTLDQMAKELEIARSTLCKWIKEDPKLSDAVKDGRSYADSAIEDSLFNRAKGMKIVEKKTIITNDSNGNPHTRIEILEKELPPDVTAGIYWLKNRKPKEWRDGYVIETDYEDLRPLADMLKIDDEE